jgi:putative oxidoreductase
VSTHEDRPTGAGGHADEGLFYPSSASGSDNSTFGFDSNFDTNQGYSDSGATTMLPSGLGATSDFGAGEQDERRVARWHGGADFGLLVLRLVVGGTFVMHGLQHLFGLFHGPGVNGYAAFLHQMGYQHDTIMAWIGGGTELGGGALLVLGLFTPLGAAGVLGLISQVIALKWHSGFFAPNGFELELTLAAGAFTLLWAGPGRVSLDRPTPWYRHPVRTAWIFLIISAGASIAAWFLAR